MEKVQSIEDIVSSIITDFFQTYSVYNPVIPDYKLVDDMYLAYQELRPDLVEKNPESYNCLNENNGLTVAPFHVGGQFTILLNKNVFIENLNNQKADWVGTIVHETVHVQDFSEYAHIIDASDYEDIIQINEHGMFNLWTEFNARSKGYFFTRKYTLGELLYSSEYVPDIMNREIPLQQEILFKKYHSTNNGFEQAYLVSHYLGRLYTLQKLFPKDFTDSWIECHLESNKWMVDWFHFFKTNPDLSVAAEHFEEMKDILRQNFSGL